MTRNYVNRNSRKKYAQSKTDSGKSGGKRQLKAGIRKLTKFLSRSFFFSFFF